MHHFASRALAGVFVVGVAAGSMGCADNNSSIFIRQVQVPDVANECVVTADPGGLMRTQGAVDPALQAFAFGDARPYNVSLLVGNQLIRRGDDETLKVETSRVQLFEAEVEVFDFQGASLTTFSQPISGFVDASSGSEPGYGLTSLTLIDGATLANAGTQTLVARVQLFGESLGGIEVETGLWDYPVSVLPGGFGCSDPENCDDPIIFGCSFGQDEIPDCRCHPSGGACGVAPGCVAED